MNSTNIFTGTAYSQFDKATRFLNLDEYADSLAKDNARLLNEVGNHKYFNTFYRDTIVNSLDTTAATSETDTIPSKDIEQRYSFITAQVINNSIVKPENYITLDRGSKHGIRPGMGVVGTNGIVGIVRKVTPHFSQVMSVLHKQINISVTVKKTHYFGTLTWKNNDPRYMILEAIPKYTALQKGDSILTSGFSSIFPVGIYVGSVESVWDEPGSNFHSAKVKLCNDMANVYYVYVVDNLFVQEYQMLIDSLN